MMLIDYRIGTTNWKVAVFSSDGNVVAQKSVAAKEEFDNFGATYSAFSMWSMVASLIKDVLKHSPMPSAVTVTSMAEAGFPLDEFHQPIFNAITWYDQRTYPQVQFIKQHIAFDTLFEITGLEANSMFTLSKILWLKMNEPNVFASMKYWVSIADFINYKLTGEIVTDYSLACRTQCFNIRKKRWSKTICDEFGIKESLFPQVKKAGTRVGSITKEAHDMTGLDIGIPIILGGHDHHCAFLAGGALLQDGTVFDSSGTVESILTLLPKGEEPPKIYKKIRISNFIDPDRYISMSGILASGGSVEWMIRSLYENEGLPDYQEILDAIEEVSPGSDGLLFLPHLTGAGAPKWEPRSKGAFVGLSVHHTKSHMVRAVYEGLCFELKILLRSVEQAFSSHENFFHTVGGGAKNRLWQQMKADITQKSVRIPDIKDATALGAALIAFVGLGVFTDFVDASRKTFKILEEYEPSPTDNCTYKELFSIYETLYETLLPTNIKLDEFRRREVK